MNLFVPRRLEKLIRATADRARPLEVGGVLVGKPLASNSALVTHLVGAGPKHNAARNSFDPDYAYQQSEFDRLHALDPQLQYLGA